MSDDDVLLARFQSGDAAAFDALYAKYGGRLYAFCFRLWGNAPEAEDATQEVFVAAYQGLHRFQGRAAVSTYLYKIALYQWKHKVRRVTQTAYSDKADSSDPSRIGVDRMELADALSTLTQSHRAAFLLVKMEGLTCREAADLLGIPVGTVKYHVHEAARLLRAHLTEGEAQADCKGGAHAL